MMDETRAHNMSMTRDEWLKLAQCIENAGAYYGRAHRNSGINDYEIAAINAEKVANMLVRAIRDYVGEPQAYETKETTLASLNERISKLEHITNPTEPCIVKRWAD